MLTSCRLSKSLGMANIRRQMVLLPALSRRLARPVSMALAHFSTEISITKLPMPSLSPTMTHGTISSWNKAPGEALKAGDILCDVETDKASVGFEVQDDGVLAKILVDAGGAEVQCGQPIALMVEDDADYQTFLKLPADAYPVAVPAAAASPPAAPSHTPSSAAPSFAGHVQLSPAARHMVQSRSLDVSAVHGSSKGGRVITKGDVIQAVKAGTARPGASTQTRATPATAVAAVASPPTPIPQTAATVPATVQDPSSNIGGLYVDVPNSNMRKVIAKRLSESKQTVPHLYTTIECEIDDLLAMRKALKKDFGVNVSVNDVVIKSVAMALRDVPECNGKWVPAEGRPAFNDAVDISVAVATPNGLITPILTSADQLGLSAINSKVKDLATRARDGKLKPQEYQGGTFTISNLGMFGISSFSAVINPPQACILAVGGGIERVVAPAPGKEQPRIVTTMTVQLSSDRRVVDEATASQFLQVFKYYLSNPKLVVL